MAYPDFSELSFGYCFLRELETRHTHGGRFPKAPDFISQYDEATKGYDVEVAMDGAVPLFIQLKRSEVMTRSNAREFRTPWFRDPPVYRMNLHSSRQYAQHQALQALEATGEAVIYATSQISNPANLSSHSAKGSIIASASAVFSPNEIRLPDFTSHHHVSFRANALSAVIFSDQGEEFERRFPSAQEWLEKLLQNPRAGQDNRQKMRNVVDLIRSQPELAVEDDADAVGSVLEDLIDIEIDRLQVVEEMARVAEGNPTIEAAIYAYFLLDVQLTFVKPPAEKG